MEKIRYFATTSKGLEETLAGEIVAIGGEEISTVTGGVAFSGNADLGMRANLWLRTANRVLRHLADFDAPTPEALYATTLRQAIAAVEEHSVSLWDAMLWATARDAGVTVLLSEDFQDGRELGGVRFRNPFVT